MFHSLFEKRNVIFSQKKFTLFCASTILRCSNIKALIRCQISLLDTNFVGILHFRLPTKIMEEFTNEEMARMHIVYGEVHCNGRAASRLYAERYLNRRVPNYRMFANMEHSAETGMMQVVHERHVHQHQKKRYCVEWKELLV